MLKINYPVKNKNVFNGDKRYLRAPGARRPLLTFAAVQLPPWAEEIVICPWPQS